MEIKDYQEIIKKTAIYPKEIGKLYCALGICGEAGEIAEKIKKLYRDKQEITEEWKTNLSKELGDILWYVTAMSNEFGFSLEEVMNQNYEKLMKRRETGTLHGSGDNRENQTVNGN